MSIILQQKYYIELTSVSMYIFKAELHESMLLKLHIDFKNFLVTC